MNRSPQNQEDRTTWGSRATLTQFPAAKTVYFYKDGDQNFNGLKLAIHPRRYRSFDTLLNELSSRIPMSFGVRSIFTPRGHDNVQNIDDLSNEGQYVCSTHPKHAKGVDLNRFGPPPAWHYTRPPSGRRALNNILSPRERDRRSRIRARRRMEVQRVRPVEPSYRANTIHGPKKITVMRNGEPTDRHIVLLNRRTAQTFEQVLADMSDMFKIAVRKIYKTDGTQMLSLSSIFNGPEMFVVAGNESFRPMAGLSPQPPLAARPRPNGYRNRLLANPERSVANRLRDRRERLGRTRGRWRVWVTTNELPSAGTDAGVTITVYGTRNNSGPLHLGHNDDTEHFQSGAIDQFDINIGNLGEVFKIRIGHDNVGEFPNWLCDEVKMKDLDTEEELVFSCKRWLARDEDDGEICRELPAVRKGDPHLPVVKYDVAVTTGELWNAGTKANVYLTMYGDRGDTGVRQLISEKKDLLFLSGQTNTFHIEAVSLGQINRVIVGHDAKDPGEGWYLEKIVARDPTKSHNQFTFYCGKWLDAGEDDGKVVRELKAQDEYMADILEKRNWEFEKWKFGPKNQVMFFSCQTGKALRIKPDAVVDALGTEDQKSAIFNVLVKRGMVRVFGNEAHRNFHLAIDNGRLLGQGKGGAYCEFRVRVQHDRTIQLESVKYPLQHVTILQNGKPGDVRGLALDVSKQFYAYCKGMFRDQGVIMLMTSPTQALCVDHNNEVSATGKKSRLAQFRVHKVSEGGVRMFESIASPGLYLRVKQGRIDCQGGTELNSHFIVEKHRDQGYVSLQSAAVKGLYIGMAADGAVRPTVNTGVKNVWLYPEVVQFGVVKVREEPEEKVPTPLPVVQPSPSPPPTTPSKEQQRREPTPVAVVQQLQSRASPQPEEPPQRVESAKSSAKPSSAKSNKSVFEDGDWKVTVSTLEPAQNAEVAVVVYGDKGTSSQIVLGSPAVNNLFQKNSLDEFKINLLTVGKIYKLRVEMIPVHINADALWKVKDVKLQDMQTKELLKFSFNKWLSLHEDDGEIMRELPAVRPGQEVLPVVKYYILVHTGKEAGSDTEAHVYVTLYGERGDTGKRLLHRSNKEVKFLVDQVDEFEVEAVSLGKLDYCVVSHDGMGPGEGWYCRQVVVREGPDATMETVFPCDQWLDSSMGDKKIERKIGANEPTVVGLPATPIEEVVDEVDTTGDEVVQVSETHDEVETEQATDQPPTPVENNEADPDVRPIPDAEPAVEQMQEEKYEDGDWKVWVSTGKEEAVKTLEDIILMAYGEDGVSEAIALGSGSDGIFQPSSTDEFKVNLGTALGSLYKIRIGHKDMIPKNGWLLEKVKMQNMTTNEILSFKGGRWLSRGQDDHDTWRELPVVRPGIDPLPVVVYRVDVYTGDVAGADTEANVYMTLYGKRGDSGQRILYRSETNDTKFQRGQVDVFQIEAVSLDEILKIVIGHDGRGLGAGWFLEKVVVKETINDQTTEYFFPCNRWLDEGQYDGLLEREIFAQAAPADSRGEYQMWIKTLPDSKPPNGGRVYVTAYGETGKSNEIEVCGGGGQATFEPGNTDEFEVILGDLGDLYKVRITREDIPQWEGWHLKEVKLKDKATEKEFVFEVDRWLSRDEDDRDVVRELPVVVDDKPILPVRHYEVQVYTGDRWAAQTEADAYITLYGNKGDSGKRRLYHSTNNEEMLRQNQMDIFTLEAVSLEELTHVVIGHTGSGHGSGWFLEKVVIVEKEGDRAAVQQTFPCGQWLDDHEGDGKTERTLRLIDSVDPKNPPPQKDANKKTQGNWTVLVKTSDLHNAGSHAQAYLTLYGSKATSQPQPLGTADPESDIFDQGKESEFTINVGDIGDFFKVRLEHDNKNDFPAWHVDYLKLRDQDTQEEITLYVDRWLAVDEDDGQLYREMAVPQPEQMILPVLHYIVVVYTGNQNEAGTDTTVNFNLYGDQGDIGHRPLMDSRTNAEPYQPGQMDVFVIEAVSVGKLQKVELFHNGQKRGQSWFVDKVVVLESEAALTESIFHCSEWLEVAEGETMAMKQFKISGTQPASHGVKGDIDMISKGHWTISTKTGSQSETTVKDDVFLVICGTLGQTEPKQLNMDGELTPGSTTELKVTVGAIGRIFKVRLFFGEKEREPSWFLKKMKLKDDDTGQEFHFNYNDWIKSTIDNPAGMTELAAIRPDIPPLQDTKYIVSVETGIHPCSETEAQVFCNLIGQWGESGQRPLATPRKSSDPFKRGQVDEFAITGLDLGQLEKVVIGHKKSGRGQGWFCEKVTVKTLTSPTEQIFQCNRWLDNGCEDRKLVRELLPLATVPIQAETDDDLRRDRSKGVWSCLVTMASVTQLSHHTVDPKQPIELSVVVCGEKGVTEAFPLDQLRPLVLGQMEEYKGLQFGDIGKIEKIRVALGNDKDPETLWVLEEIILEDEETKESLRFDFGSSVGKILWSSCKEMPVVRPAEPVKPVLTYVVNVHTSNDKDASTYSPVFLTLYGKGGDSGKRHLAMNSKKSSKFLVGQVDEFAVEAVDLGELEKVMVVKGPGDPWHLDKVVVKGGAYASTEDVFLYDSWIGDSAQQDKEIPITIPVSGQEMGSVAIPRDLDPSLPESKGSWKVETLTGKEQKKSAGMDIVVVLCGDQGETEPVPMVTSTREAFKPGNLDDFKMDVTQNVGELFKVRIGFADRTKDKAWKLQRIAFLDEDTDDRFSYELDDWLKVDKTQDGWKEFPIIWPALPILPVIQYQVSVHLGDVHNISQNISVFLRMDGENGSTGQRQLKKAVNNNNRFQSNEVDLYEVEAVTLRDINKVILSHDSNAPGAGFFVKKVVIKETAESEKEYCFECEKWLDAGEDDKLTERVLILGERPVAVTPAVTPEDKPDEETDKPGDDWKVSVTTKSEPDSWTRAAAVLILYGDKGQSSPVIIGEQEDFEFKDGTTEQFDVKVEEDVGEVYKVRVGFHDVDARGNWFTDYSLAPSWFIDKIVLQNVQTAAEYTFEADTWIKVDGDRDYWREFPVVTSDKEKELKVVRYDIQMHTGDKLGAGTDSNVYLQLFGERGDSGPRQMLKSANHDNKFEQGQVDNFMIEAVDLSRLTKVKVGHNGDGPGSGWFLDKIVIKETQPPRGEYVFECDKWLDVGEDDNLIERELHLTKFIPEQDNSTEDEPDCRVLVTTSSEADSGTDAKVTLTVIGQSGDSGPCPLTKEDKKDVFVAGQTESFDVSAKLAEIGAVKKIRLEHDNSGTSPGWRVDKVVLENLSDQTRLEFVVNKHLSYEGKHGDVVVEVPVEGTSSDDNLQVKQYYVEVDTGESIGGGTDANVYMTLFGEQGDSGKRVLKTSLEGGDKFESGKIDTFIVEAVDLGKLTCIVIGHDGSGAGSGWKLDNVMVREGKEAEDKVIFHCGQWLDADEGDRKTERELFPLQDDDEEEDDD